MSFGKSERRIRLAEQSAQVLTALLERAGDLVTRDELRERLWPADSFVDFDHGLNSAIRRLRNALGDSADRPKFVETLPRKGYRFVARVGSTPVQEGSGIAGDAPLIPPRAPENSPIPPATAARRTNVRSWIALGATLSAVALYAALVALSPDKSGDAAEWAPLRLTFEDGLQTEPVFSPDGQSVAYAANVSGQLNIYTRRISVVVLVRITTDAADDWQPDWSPDGNSVVFRSERAGGGIYVAPINGGPEQRLADFGLSSHLVAGRRDDRVRAIRPRRRDYRTARRRPDWRRAAFVGDAAWRLRMAGARRDCRAGVSRRPVYSNGGKHRCRRPRGRVLAGGRRRRAPLSPTQVVGRRQ